MERKNEQAQSSTDSQAKVGSEQQQPGEPTRHVAPTGEKGASDVEEIARQQGATQRGYTADGPKENRPAQFDPKHPGGRPEGDPRR